MTLKSGTLLYRFNQSEIQVLLISQNGKRWLIPSGEAGQRDSLETVAREALLKATGIEGPDVFEFMLSLDDNGEPFFCYVGAYRGNHEIQDSAEAMSEWLPIDQARKLVIETHRPALELLRGKNVKVA